MPADLKTRIGDKQFKNPVWVASGTFGNAQEFQDLIDLGKVGAIITKTVTYRARRGNRSPRIVETPSGLLNSIGLENKGVKRFREEDYPFLLGLGTRFIVSIAGHGLKDLEKCAGELTGKNAPDAIEVNLSCPNVAHSGTRHALISQDRKATERTVRAVKRIVDSPVIAKLTPNVTDVGAIAEAAESGGADAVALVNTYLGMAVDAEEMKPVLGNVVGGLSGPAIKPLALKAVTDAYKRVNIPVIGIGGIMSGEDVAEFMLCGASAVQVGTANLADPASHNRILGEFTAYLERKKIKRAADLVGVLRV